MILKLRTVFVVLLIFLLKRFKAASNIIPDCEFGECVVPSGTSGGTSSLGVRKDPDTNCFSSETTSQEFFISKFKKFTTRTKIYRQGEDISPKIIDDADLVGMEWVCSPPGDFITSPFQNSGIEYKEYVDDNFGSYEGFVKNIKDTLVKNPTLNPEFGFEEGMIMQGVIVVGDKWYRKEKVTRSSFKDQDQKGVKWVIPVYNYLPNLNNILYNPELANTNILYTVFVVAVSRNLFDDQFLTSDTISYKKLYYKSCQNFYGITDFKFVYDGECSSNEKVDCAGITGLEIKCKEIKCDLANYYASNNADRTDEPTEKYKVCKELKGCEQCDNGSFSNRKRCAPLDEDCASCNVGFKLDLSTPENKNERELCRLECTQNENIDNRLCFGGTARDPAQYVYSGVKFNPLDQIAVLKSKEETCQKFFLRKVPDEYLEDSRFESFEEAFLDKEINEQSDSALSLLFNNYKLDVWLQNPDNVALQRVGCQTPGGLEFSQCKSTCYAGYEYNDPCCVVIDGCERVVDDSFNRTGREVCDEDFNGAECFSTQSELDGPRQFPFYSCNCTCDSSSFCGEDPENPLAPDICLCKDKYVYDSESRSDSLVGATSKMCFTCLNSLGFEDSTCSGHGVCTASPLALVRPQCVCLDGYIGKGCEFLQTVSFSCGSLWDVSCSPDVLLQEQFQADTSWLFSNSWECAMTPVGNVTLGSEYGLGFGRQTLVFKKVALTKGVLQENNFEFLNKQKLCWSFAYKMVQGFTAADESKKENQFGLYNSINQDFIRKSFEFSPLNYQFLGEPWQELTTLKRKIYDRKSGLISGNRGLCPFPFNEDLSIAIDDRSLQPQLLQQSLENDDIRFVACRAPSADQVFSVQIDLLPNSFYGRVALGENITSWPVNCFILRETLKGAGEILLRCLRLEGFPHIDCVVDVPLQFTQISASATITWSEAGPGESCHFFCEKKSQRCSSELFESSNTGLIYENQLYNFESDACLNVTYLEFSKQFNISLGKFEDVFTVPYRDLSTGRCFAPNIFVNDPWQFSCRARKDTHARLCPCVKKTSSNIVLDPKVLPSLITNQCVKVET